MIDCEGLDMKLQELEFTDELYEVVARCKSCLRESNTKYSDPRSRDWAVRVTEKNLRNKHGQD